MNSWLAGTLGRSRANKWRPNWAHSKLPHYPWSPKRRNQANIVWFTTSPIRTPHAWRCPQSIPTLAAMISHAHGARSPLSCCSLHACLQVCRHRCGMWRKHIERFPHTPTSGQASSYDCKGRTASQLTYVTILGLHQQEGCTAWLQMRERTFFVAEASARWQSGSMTTFSSDFHAEVCWNTTCVGQAESVRYKNGGMVYKKVADGGMEGRTYRAAPRRSLTRTAQRSFETWQRPPLVRQKISHSPMLTRTLTSCRSASVFTGSPQRQSPLVQRSRTLGLVGTCARMLCDSLTKKGRNTYQQLKNGRENACTICWKHKSYMASFTTP